MANCLQKNKLKAIHGQEQDEKENEPHTWGHFDYSMPILVLENGLKAVSIFMDALIDGKQVKVVVDFEVTHNFIQVEALKKLGRKYTPTEKANQIFQYSC